MSEFAPLTLDELFRRMRAHGDAEYQGEAVSQMQHALQTAHQAEREGASPALVAAALFHDVGHLFAGLGEDAAQRGIDDVHEDLGAAMLRAVLPPEVAGPVRLHVEAKRCLCATDPAYFAELSDASRLSLELQGGVMSPDEVEAFLAVPFAAEALQLRRWDDQAKDPKAVTPDLAHYQRLITTAFVVPPSKGK